MLFSSSGCVREAASEAMVFHQEFHLRGYVHRQFLKVATSLGSFCFDKLLKSALE